MKNTKWKRNASLFILSQGITLFGSSIVQMAIIWQVALETSSGLWVTLLTLSSTIPQTVLSFFGGVWADRYPRKRLIILADLAIAAVTLGLAMIFFFGSTANIMPLIILVSALRSFGAGVQTPAVSAVIPQIVPEEHLMQYNGINGSMMSIVQFAAPAAAGAILYIGPFHWVLLIDVVTAVIGVSLLSAVTIAHVKSQSTSTGHSAFFAELKAGVSYAATNRIVRRLLLTFGAFIFLCVPSGFLVVLLIERTFGSSYAFLTVSENGRLRRHGAGGPRSRGLGWIQEAAPNSAPGIGWLWDLFTCHRRYLPVLAVCHLSVFDQLFHSCRAILHYDHAAGGCAGGEAGAGFRSDGGHV